jgi:hypothetical protein
VPIDFSGKVAIPGMPDIRSDIDNPDSPVIQKSLMDSFKEESESDYPADALGIRTYPVLAVSAGGPKGAYGAGFIRGWSKEGSRPVFKVITGVSSGAIIALCVFLGKDYDDPLEKFFTTMSTKDIMKQKNFLSILLGNSLANPAPLAKKIASIVDEKLVARVAEEHRRGRRLFMGTVNLDAQKFVVWDMGALACKGGVESVNLFRKILLASTSMPIMFPPVFFEVSSASGELYSEMHVDGGAIREVFYIDPLTKNMVRAGKASGRDLSKYKPKIYVLITSYMFPIKQQVKDRLVDIGVRSLDTLEAAAYYGDIYRLFVSTQETGLDFNLAYIPADFRPDPKEIFDAKEMQSLFKRGYDDAVHGYKWHKTPPDYAAEDERAQKTDEKIFSTQS